MAYPPCQSYVCLHGKTKGSYRQGRSGSLSTAPEPLRVSTARLSSSPLGSGLWVFPASHRDVSCSQPVFPASLSLWPPEEGNGRMVLAHTQRQTPIRSFLTWGGGRHWNWLSHSHNSALLSTRLYPLCSYSSDSDLLRFKGKSCWQRTKTFSNPP